MSSDMAISGGGRDGLDGGIVRQKRPPSRMSLYSGGEGGRWGAGGRGGGCGGGEGGCGGGISGGAGLGHPSAA